MRIWSIHPKYLDAKGLVALWRETLLAKNVLEGKTRGYTNHPQLTRFKALSDPLTAINHYLEEVHHEAQSRAYNFDRSKFEVRDSGVLIPVTQGQIRYEFEHLLNKLQTRDPERFEKLKSEKVFVPHPLFTVVDGGVEDWEKIKQ
jgi:hypothetical protein